MIKTNPVSIESVMEHDIEEEALLSVIINGEFKTVVFYKLDGKYYIIIGNTSAYRAACYWNSASISGYALIEGTGEWYATSESENAAIYNEIISTKKISKKGKPYYKFDLKGYDMNNNKKFEMKLCKSLIFDDITKRLTYVI